MVCLFISVMEGPVVVLVGLFPCHSFATHLAIFELDLTDVNDLSLMGFSLMSPQVVLVAVGLATVLLFTLEWLVVHSFDVFLFLCLQCKLLPALFTFLSSILVSLHMGVQHLPGAETPDALHADVVSVSVLILHVLLNLFVCSCEVADGANHE